MQGSHRCQIDANECLICTAIRSRNYFHYRELFFVAFPDKVQLQSLGAPLEILITESILVRDFSEQFLKVIIFAMS